MELKIENLGKQYSLDKWGIRNFNLTITEGVTGLLGPNGAGKTSLIRMLATIMNPTEGGIHWNGQDIFRAGKNYREVLGYLPQDFGVYPTFTAQDFLEYMASLKGISKQLARKKTDELLDYTGLAEVRHKKLKTYSGGMKQRIGIAQALLNDPEILIVDEPTVGLDPEERNKFRNLIARLGKDRIVILSTHIVSDLEAAGQMIALLNNGSLFMYENTDVLMVGLEGKVFEIIVPYENLKDYEDRYIISSSAPKRDGVQLRIVSDDIVARGQLVEPNLEDVYLYYFRRR